MSAPRLYVHHAVSCLSGGAALTTLCKTGHACAAFCISRSCPRFAGSGAEFSARDAVKNWMFPARFPTFSLKKGECGTICNVLGDSLNSGQTAKAVTVEKSTTFSLIWRECGKQRAAETCGGGLRRRPARADSTKTNDSIIDNTDNSIEIVGIDNYEYENTAST